MRAGVEVAVAKVGVVTILALGVVAMFLVYVRGALVSGEKFTVYVNFDNSRGLQQGDPVRMLGVKIGEVEAVEITPLRKAQAKLAILRRYPLHAKYLFRVATSGLIQERFVEVVPTEPGMEGLLLEDGATVSGASSSDLSDLLLAGQDLIRNLDQTSRQVQAVLGNKEIAAGLQRALDGFANAAASAAELTDAGAAIARQSQPLTLAILEQFRLAAADVRRSTARLRAALEEGGTVESAQGIIRNAEETTENVDRLTKALADLASDPETQQRLKESVTAVHEAALTLQRVSADLEVFSGKLREAAPSVPRLAARAEEVADTAVALKQSLNPPDIRGDFRVVYSAKADRSFSTGSLDVISAEDRFLRLGIDDIGEESAVNIQIGERQQLGTLRYGLVRSRLGLGFDLQLPRRGSLSLDLFDPNALRGDILASVPLVLGDSDLSLVAGMRDLGQGNLYVVGARLQR